MALLVPDTGIGNSPPARKLAVSPDSAVRFGSARLRARPRCSSALIRTSMVVPPARMRPSRNPNGDAPDRRPAATSPAGTLVGLVGAVIGNSPGERREPMFDGIWLFNPLHRT